MTSATFIFGFNAKAVEMGMARLKGSVSSFASSMAGMLAGGLAIGSVIAGFKSAIAEGAKLQDLSDRFNLPASEIGKFAAAGKEMGVSVDDVAKSMAKLSINQTKALQGNEGLQNAFAKVGITMDDLEKSSPTDLMNKVADAFKSGAVSGDEMAVAMELLGKGGINMVGMLQQGSDGIAKMAESMGYFDDETVAALDEADDAISKLGTQAMLVFGQVASAIAPAVKVLADLVKTLNDVGALLPILGAVTGFMMGGPVGAAVGAATGLALQASTGKNKAKSGEKSGKGDFAVDPDTGEKISKRGSRKVEAEQPKELTDREKNQLALKQNQNAGLSNKLSDLKNKRQMPNIGQKNALKLDEEIAKTTEQIFKNNDDMDKISGKKGKKGNSQIGADLGIADTPIADMGAQIGAIGGGKAKGIENGARQGGDGASGKGVTDKLDKIYSVLTEIKNQNHTFN